MEQGTSLQILEQLKGLYRNSTNSTTLINYNFKRNEPIRCKGQTTKHLENILAVVSKTRHAATIQANSCNLGHLSQKKCELMCAQKPVCKYSLQHHSSELKVDTTWCFQQEWLKIVWWPTHTHAMVYCSSKRLHAATWMEVSGVHFDTAL